MKAIIISLLSLILLGCCKYKKATRKCNLNKRVINIIDSLYIERFKTNKWKVVVCDNNELESKIKISTITKNKKSLAGINIELDTTYRIKNVIYLFHGFD
jgi:hypothetical protein